MNSEITNWLNTQHLWLKEAAKRVLENGVLVESDYQDLLDLIVQQSESPEEAQKNEKSASGSPEVISSELKLRAVGAVEGIDNLTPQIPLEFGKKTSRLFTEKMVPESLATYVSSSMLPVLLEQLLQEQTFSKILQKSKDVSFRSR